MPPPALPAAPPDPFLGRRIGNYRVERKLGEGGMGAVYLLQHTELAETFQALKVLTGEAADSQRAQERFRQEALAAAAVGSRRVARPIDLGHFEDGTPYIIMEFVAGRSLESELAALGVLPLTRALKIAVRIADTMALAHQKGIIHRDLKPANIMLPEEGERDAQIKILDFGIARASGGLRVAITMERAVIGTPGYMSPEAIIAAPVDGRTDVFALGVILHQMLTGRLPFSGATVEAKMMAAIAEPTPAMADHQPPGAEMIPPRVEAIVAQALSKRADDRFTMAQLHGALQEALDEAMAGEGPGRIHSLRVPVAANIFDSPTLANGQGEVDAILQRLHGSTPQPATPRPGTPLPAQDAPTTPEARPPMALGLAEIDGAARGAGATSPPRHRRMLILGAAAGAILLIGLVAQLLRPREPAAAIPPPPVAGPAVPPPQAAAAATVARPAPSPAVTPKPTAAPTVVASPRTAKPRPAKPDAAATPRSAPAEEPTPTPTPVKIKRHLDVDWGKP